SGSAAGTGRRLTARSQTNSLLVWCLAIGWCFAARDFRLPFAAQFLHRLLQRRRTTQVAWKRHINQPRPTALLAEPPERHSGNNLSRHHRAPNPQRPSRQVARSDPALGDDEPRTDRDTSEGRHQRLRYAATEGKALGRVGPGDELSAGVKQRVLIALERFIHGSRSAFNLSRSG